MGIFGDDEIFFMGQRDKKKQPWKNNFGVTFVTFF